MEQDYDQEPETVPSSVESNQQKQRDIRALMLGLDGSGKTSILYNLILGEIVNSIPTIGFNVETLKRDKTNITIWDVGGQDKIRMLWRHYYANTQCLIYVVDSTVDNSFESRLDQAREVLHETVLSDEELKGVPLVVLANKQDKVSGVYTTEEITEKLELNTLKGRQWYIQGVSSITAQGLHEAINWIIEVCPGTIKQEEPEQNQQQQQQQEQELEQEQQESKKVLILGLSNSGKTTILYKLKLGEIVTTIPTNGFNVESIIHNKKKLDIWDIGGGQEIREKWESFYEGTTGLIYVVDSCDSQNILLARDTLWGLLNNQILKDVPLLVLANKHELFNSLSLNEIVEQLQLHKIKREWFFQSTSAFIDQGINQAMDWLTQKIQ